MGVCHMMHLTKVGHVKHYSPIKQFEFENLQFWKHVCIS